MERFEQRQRSKATQAIYPSQVIKMPRSRETFFPAVEGESVGPSQGRSDFGDPGGHTSYESEREDPRCPLMAPAKVSMNQGPSPQCIRFSVIGELKEFNGRDRDENQARSWISKVKSAFLRGQIPDEEKCLLFGDLLTGPAHNWHNQLSRTTRHT